ncbi:hypothetical protein ACEPAG_2025 [Sanghuangporus baumii]
MLTSTDELKTSLEGHSAEFETLLRLIPAKYYLVPEDSGEYTSKYQKNSKKQKAPKQAIKEASKKAKRDKLDPANNKTIIELQEEAALLKKTNAISKRKGKAREASDDDEDKGTGSGAEYVGLDMDRMDVDGDDVSADENDASGEEDSVVKFKPMEAPASIETLRAKLRARMEELRQKNGRNKLTSQSNGDPESKDELLEERRKQRAAMREKRRKETKEKKRKEEEERKKKGKDKERQQASNGPNTKTQLLVPDVYNAPSGSSSKLTNITFSTLSGTTPHTAKHLKTSSNPAQALTQLQSHLSTLSSLPPEKRKEHEEREKWEKANARVAGVKVHDDPARLAKAVKRKEKEKAKSKKDWEARKEEVAKAQAARTKKRADNIAMRHEKKKSKGKGKKDGKRRPGFEGKGFGSGGRSGVKKAGSSSKGKGRK